MRSLCLIFTDIADSTRLWDRYPDTFLEVVRRHDAILSALLGQFGGREVKKLGDGLFVTFTEPAQAIGFATAAQRGIECERWTDLVDCVVKIRIGVHFGDPHAYENDLV